MALAFINTNVRRRIGRGKNFEMGSRSKQSKSQAKARRKLRKKYQALVGPDGDWSSNKQLKAQYEAEAAAGGYSAKDMLSHVTGSSQEMEKWRAANVTDEGGRNAYRKRRHGARKDAIWEISEAPGYGKRGSGFVSRNFYRSHAGQYKAKGKKTHYSVRYPKTASGRPRKTPVVFGRKSDYLVVDVPASRAYNASREGWRGQSKWIKDRKWQPPIGPGVSTTSSKKKGYRWTGGKSGQEYKASGAYLAGLRSGIGTHVTHKKGKKRVRTYLETGKGKGGGEGFMQQEAQALAEMEALGNRRSPYKRRARRNGLAFVRNNPNGVLGDLQSRFMAAVPVLVYGSAAGAVHAGLSGLGLTATIADTFAMIPVVGPPIADNIPFTLQGLVIGVLGGAVVGMVAGGRGGLGAAIAPAIPVLGYAVAIGGAFDAFYFVLDQFDSQADAQVEAEIAAESDALLAEAEAEAEELDLGALAFEGGALNGLSGIAFEEGGALNGLSGIAYEGGALNGPDLGDGMAYEIGSLASGGWGGTQGQATDYGQASMADAHYSGADFSAAEGSALANGHGYYQRTFGTPPYRMALAPFGPSHLAGREGHRWGWLIKMVGWRRAAQIAALSPQQRLATLREMRQAAITSFDQMKAQHGAGMTPDAAPASVVTPEVTEEIGGLFGDPALFMGA